MAEETLTSLLSEDGEYPETGEWDRPRRLVVTSRTGVGGAELEFLSASEGENLEDRLSYLGETPDIPDSREISFRLLRHYASSVRHQKYHGSGHRYGQRRWVSLALDAWQFLQPCTHSRNGATH